jgi:hypothetical protein
MRPDETAGRRCCPSLRQLTSRHPTSVKTFPGTVLLANPRRSRVMRRTPDRSVRASGPAGDQEHGEGRDLNDSRPGSEPLVAQPSPGRNRDLLTWPLIWPDQNSTSPHCMGSHPTVLSWLSMVAQGTQRIPSGAEREVIHRGHGPRRARRPPQAHAATRIVLYAPSSGFLFPHATWPT